MQARWLPAQTQDRNLWSDLRIKFHWLWERVRSILTRVNDLQKIKILLMSVVLALKSFACFSESKWKCIVQLRCIEYDACVSTLCDFWPDQKGSSIILFYMYPYTHTYTRTYTYTHNTQHTPSHNTQNTTHKTLNTKHKTLNTKHKTLNTKHNVHNT